MLSGILSAAVSAGLLAILGWGMARMLRRRMPQLRAALFGEGTEGHTAPSGDPLVSDFALPLPAHPRRSRAA